MSQALFLSTALILVSSLGCAMCDSSMDCQYNAYGGVRDRIDRVNGRVSSLFDPAASLDAVLAPEEPLEEETGTDADAGGDGSDAGGAARDLTEDLLRELDKMEALPELRNDDST